MADSKKYDGSQWEHSLRKLTTATDTFTTLPVDIYADGNNATVGLKGNMSQTGTPTPQNPIMPQGTGERTENLWGETSTTNRYIDNQGNTGTNPSGDVYSLKTFTVSPSTTYTFSWSGFTVGNDNNLPYIRICFYTSNGGTFISRTLVNPNDYLDKYVSFTIPNNCTYIDIRIDSEASTRGQHFDNIMFNTGSTAKPYEPYGYKIPISSASIATPVYLGEVQTTRKIKKYEFTGQEEWSISNNERVLYVALADHITSNELICYCSHYKSIANISAISTLSNGECAFNNTLRWFYIKDDNYNSENSFKTYLQQQYANGTPVTVWYVLATETTDIVNEPLRKIGNYVDTVSGITIPTITGADSFDVLTTLKPSEVSLSYTGWHDATVKEWDGSQWQ